MTRHDALEVHVERSFTTGIEILRRAAD